MLGKPCKHGFLMFLGADYSAELDRQPGKPFGKGMQLQRLVVQKKAKPACSKAAPRCILAAFGKHFRGYRSPLWQQPLHRLFHHRSGGIDQLCQPAAAPVALFQFLQIVADRFVARDMGQ
ncbi:hypothetical protein QW131_11505 [Roseibium salinum]|nr:hypothetical protein [Roseibium salinum]